MRISRDRMFMEIAEVVAKRGTCNRAQVGAVLVRDRNIIAIGYNGAPSGHPHCDVVGHQLVDGHCTNATHAEINCIIKILNEELIDRMQPHTLYVTHFPCSNCVDYILMVRRLNINIARVIYLHDYGQMTPRRLLEVGVEVGRLKVEADDSRGSDERTGSGDSEMPPGQVRFVTKDELGRIRDSTPQ